MKLSKKRNRTVRWCWEKYSNHYFVNLEGSEELLARQITTENKTLYCLRVGVQERTVWTLIDTGAPANVSFHRDIEALPQRHILRPPGTIMWLSWKNQALPQPTRVTPSG